MKSDTFDAIDRDYINNIYNKIDHSRAIDLCGWQAASTGVSYRSHNCGKIDFSPYVADYRNGIDGGKKSIASLLCAWDKRNFELDEFHVLPSATMACLATLAVIRYRGIRLIGFETPAYFATIQQAQLLGFDVERLATYWDNSYCLQQAPIRKEPMALWLTQPRYCIGADQQIEVISSILNSMKSTDILVIDEANEQKIPSITSGIQDSRIMRIRGVFKPLGLNSLRVAMVLHHRSAWKDFEHVYWASSGSVDAFSFDAAVALGLASNRFVELLQSVRAHVSARWDRVEAICSGTSLNPSDLVNGYIGCVTFRHGRPLSERDAVRRYLMEAAARHNIPLVLGPKMGFANDDGVEQIRINCFAPEGHVERGLEIFRSIALAL